MLINEESGLVKQDDLTSCKYETNLQSILAALQQTNRQLEQKNQELEAFAYTLAHDLSIPLCTISRFAELLSLDNQANPNPQHQRYIENILEATAQMKLFISNLLEYPPVGHQAVSYKPIALHELLSQLARGLQLLLDEKQAQIFIPEDLPIIEGDPALLSQIFMNLFSNALTYCRQGISPEIRVKCKVEPHHVIIGVADNGIGFAAQDYDKIFTIFQRLQHNEQYPGTGIGLAAVKQAVELMNGQVWVESVVGEGSTFWVKLPLLVHS
jgi:light-regulated signal transduction histidine kinase (bacteriophytochrome)